MRISSDKRICIGEIATAHGVRGLVKVRCFGDDPSVLESYGPLYTTETGDKTMTLRLKHEAGGAAIAEVEGIRDRNDAEKLRGTRLWTERQALPPIAEEGIYYHADLIGLEAHTADGAVVGTVTAVENFGASDLLEIKPPAGKKFFLPFVDDYVGEVDLDAGTVIVEIPEGLLE